MQNSGKTLTGLAETELDRWIRFVGGAAEITREVIAAEPSHLNPSRTVAHDLEISVTAGDVFESDV